MLHTFKKKKKTPEFTKKLTEIDFFDPQNGQNSKVNLAKKFVFLCPLSTYELYFWIFCVEKKIKIVPPNSLNDLKKKKKKYTRFSPKNIRKGKYAPHHTGPTPHHTHTINTALEALLIFFRASRGPKGDQLLCVAKSIRY